MKKEKKIKNNSGISAKTLGIISALIAGVTSIALFVSLFMLSNRFNSVQGSTNNYMSWKQTANDVKDASDYLTDQARYYVFEKKDHFMDNYFYEAKVSKRRDHAIVIMEKFLSGTKAQEHIENAVTKSKALMEVEYCAMRLVVDTIPGKLEEIEYDEIIEAPVEKRASLSDDEKISEAYELVIGSDYLLEKEYIIQEVNDAVSEIDTMMENNVINSTRDLKSILVIQEILIALIIVVLSIGIFFIFHFLIRPMERAVKHLQGRDEMEIKGVKEYRYLASVYNEVREQNNSVKEKLQYEAEHDRLTGLYNRTGYDSIYRRLKLKKCFYVLIDIDFFKKVNDAYGHEIGDKVLTKVGDSIFDTFSKENEYCFRLGGDEFAVIIEDDTNITFEDIKKKCEQMTNKISSGNKKLPSVSISVGIAKGDEEDTVDTLFRKADIALYTAKNNGRHNINIYKEDK